MKLDPKKNYAKPGGKTGKNKILLIDGVKNKINPKTGKSEGVKDVFAVKLVDTNGFVSFESGYYSSKERALETIHDLVHTDWKQVQIDDQTEGENHERDRNKF